VVGLAIFEERPSSSATPASAKATVAGLAQRGATEGKAALEEIAAKGDALEQQVRAVVDDCYQGHRNTCRLIATRLPSCPRKAVGGDAEKQKEHRGDQVCAIAHDGVRHGRSSELEDEASVRPFPEPAWHRQHHGRSPA